VSLRGRERPRVFLPPPRRAEHVRGVGVRARADNRCDHPPGARIFREHGEKVFPLLPLTQGGEGEGEGEGEEEERSRVDHYRIARPRERECPRSPRSAMSHCGLDRCRSTLLAAPCFVRYQPSPPPPPPHPRPLLQPWEQGRNYAFTHADCIARVEGLFFNDK
jgi:hypothetical protein